jgi:hypothetical protein
MPTNLYWIEDNRALVMEHAGLIRYEQVREVFQRIAEMDNVRYMLIVGSEMMLESPDVFKPIELDQYVLAIVGSPNFRASIEVIPEDHPIRIFSTQKYMEMGLLHKVRYVETREDGNALLRELLAAESR